MNTEEKINTIVSQYCRNRSHLADMLGITPQTIANWIMRDAIPHKAAEAILRRFPELSRDWIMGSSEGTAMLVVGTNPSCGDGVQLDSYEELIPVSLPRRDVRYILRCKGDSMSPRINHGDYVGVGEPVSRYEPFRRDAFYLIVTTTGQTMVKQLADPGTECPYLQLSTVNPDYQLENDGHLPKDEFLKAYRVLIIINNV